MSLRELDLFAAEALADPYPLMTRLRDTSPVHRVPGSRVHLVSRWEDVQDVVMRPDDFSSHLRRILVRDPDGTVREQSMDGDGTVEQVLATADDPQHRAHRTLLMASLSKRVRALTGYVETRTDALWDDVHAQASAGEPVEWVSAMADPLPISVISHLIGLPHEDVDQLSGWVFDSTEMLGGVVEAHRFEELAGSVTELWGYLEKHFTRALASPRDDLLGVLAEAHGRRELESATAVLILIQLVGAGGESTSALLSSMARILAERPDLHERLREDPSAPGLRQGNPLLRGQCAGATGGHHRDPATRRAQRIDRAGGAGRGRVGAEHLRTSPCSAAPQDHRPSDS